MKNGDDKETANPSSNSLKVHWWIKISEKDSGQNYGSIELGLGLLELSLQNSEANGQRCDDNKIITR